MDFITTFTMFFTLVTLLTDPAQTKVVDPEIKSEKPTQPPTQGQTVHHHHIQLLPTTVSPTVKNLELQSTTVAPTLKRILLKPPRPYPSRHTVNKCCKVGQWAASRGYNCLFDRVYYREFRNMAHRRKMKFHGKDYVPYIDRQVVRKIRRCVDSGLKTLTSMCCRNMVMRQRRWSVG